MPRSSESATIDAPDHKNGRAVPTGTTQQKCRLCPPKRLHGDMRRGDVAALQTMDFRRGPGTLELSIDCEIRDYLIDALRRR
jgi:hypothetical protein